MGKSVGEIQRMLYDMAKANPEKRFHSLYDKIQRLDVLELKCISHLETILSDKQRVCHIEEVKYIRNI